jgi:hypothetical protein
VRNFVGLLIFLQFVSESTLTQTVYATRMFAPFDWVDTVIFDPTPIKIRPLDLFFMIAMFVAGVSKGQRVIPMKNTLLLAIATTVIFFVIGSMRGGDSRAGSWQVYLMIAAPVAAFAISSTHTKAVHFYGLAKWVLAAALYRAVMCIIFYFNFVRNSLTEVPQWMTTHADTVLWVTAMAMLIVNFLQERTTWAKIGAFVFFPVLLAAVQFNNRRLAYVSFAVSLMALYLLMPASAAKRKLKRIGLAFVPVIGIYVAVGWGRPEKIFKPLASLHSVSSKPDSSTLARNVENLGLIATASYSPITGTGWGHKYVEISDKYSIAAAMELWQYVPHNSILGLFGYTGFLGLIGYWLMFPTTIFLHARLARLAKVPLHKSIGLVGVMGTIICINQMFGDMGIFAGPNMYMLSMLWAAALRVPIEAGVWPNVQPAQAPAAPRAQPPQPQPQTQSAPAATAVRS